MKEKSSLLSLLWIFVTFNYLYCDLIGLMDSSLLKQYLTGSVDGMIINEQFLLYAAMLMEIPIAMIVLSKILSPIPNAYANIGAGFIKTVVMIATFFVGSSTIYYRFFATVEIATTIFIIWYAIQWLRAQKLQKFSQY